MVTNATQKGSHIKWSQVLKNVSIHLFYFILPIGKCCKMIFNVFGNLMIFFSIKNSDWIFLFHIYFSHLCKIANQKADLLWYLYLKCFFNHIVTFWKNYMNFCVRWVTLTIFGEESFIFSFVDYGLVKNSPAVRLDECEMLLQPN